MSATDSARDAIEKPIDIGLCEEVFKLPYSIERCKLEWCAVIAQSAWLEGGFQGRTCCHAINIAINVAVRLLQEKSAPAQPGKDS